MGQTAVAAEVTAGLGGLGQQVSEHVAQVLLCSGDVLVWMQQCREFDAVGLVE